MKEINVNKFKLLGVLAAVVIFIFGSLANLGRTIRYAWKKNKR